MKEKDKFYLRQFLLQMIVEGKCTFSETELNNWAESLSLAFQEQNWFCVTVKPTSNNSSKETTLQLLQLCRKVIAGENIPDYVFLDSNMNVIMLLPDCEGNHKISVQNIAKKITQRVCVPVYFGVGNSYPTLSQMFFSREEAYEALEWAGEQLAVANIRDINFTHQESNTSIQADSRRILEAFKNGKVSDLNTELQTLAEKVRVITVIQSDAPYPTSIRRTMIELLVEMLHIASDAGVDVDAQIGYVDPYRKIFELHSTPEIIQWVTEIAKSVNEAMLSRKKRIEEIQMVQALEYIQSHLSDIELNLTSVSQSIGMSPSYFSAFFIREAGMGFKEYVTAGRIALAQKLLRETKGSVNEISEQCGFLSPSYFISVFKNQTGMTPGAYRKLKN